MDANACVEKKIPFKMIPPRVAYPLVSKEGLPKDQS
jgi:hypothetical protein